MLAFISQVITTERQLEYSSINHVPNYTQDIDHADLDYTKVDFRKIEKKEIKKQPTRYKPILDQYGHKCENKRIDSFPDQMKKIEYSGVINGMYHGKGSVLQNGIRKDVSYSQFPRKTTFQTYGMNSRKTYRPGTSNTRKNYLMNGVPVQSEKRKTTLFNFSLSDSIENGFESDDNLSMGGYPI